MNEPFSISERESTEIPSFRDEGIYTVVDANTQEVITGKFFLDTRVVEQTGGSKEWETMLKIAPENKIAPVDESDLTNIDRMYKEEGEIWRLWDLEEDTEGTKAAEIHQKILESVKHGAPAQEIQEAVSNLRNRLN